MRFLPTALLVAVAIPSFSQTPNGSEALSKLFEEGPGSLSYTTEFENALPESRLSQVLRQIEGQLGEFRTVSGNTNPYTVIFERGTATAQIALTQEGRIAGLRFTQLKPQAANMEEALSKIDSLPGNTAYLVRKGDRVLAARNADEALPVGSAFKLAVLTAVRSAVDAGRLNWNETFELKDAWKSLPTGILQDWPAGTPLTLQTLATLMISISDNTATDALIDIVGRSAVEEYAPESLPFLTTSEAFKLKNPENSDLLGRYRSASPARKRRILSELENRPLPAPSLFSSGPVAQDIEWFLSVRDLCNLVEGVHDLGLLTINPGVANPENWRRIAYKGGSEPGIINLTTYLESADGERYCVSVTNVREDAVVDEIAVYSAYQGILSTLE
jgi:beta-lactamase class A